MPKLLNNALELYAMSGADQQRSSKSRYEIIHDTIACRREYKTSVNDYLAFGWSILPEEYREHYLSRNHNYHLSVQVNNMGLENKWLVYQKLKPYFLRKVVHTEESPREEVEEFMAQNKHFFAKRTQAYGGKGVQHIIQNGQSSEALLQELREGGFYVLEEVITQHEEINRLNPYCINTVRIVTCRNKSGEIITMPSIIRVGGSEKPVDNISSGGFYTLITPDGKIGLEGFYQENIPLLVNNSLIEKEHPVTGTNPLGIKIPFFQEGMEKAISMAQELEDMSICGWDIAITEHGPDVVEVNSFSGLDINQNYYFTKILGLPHVGMKTKIEEHLKIKIHADFTIEYL